MRYARTFGFIYAALAAAIFLFASPVRAEDNTATFEKVKVIYTMQADDHSAGDEHEVEYDVAASATETPERQQGRRTRQQSPRN
ncbi:hypothetical protein [Hyphococcus sp.]|uniref:hypothetical protein n=1 Tax=Hyphococcus sp. TaxID=2038636 RepID=UPI0035C752D1